ncbi:VOC family protein [Streptococcus parauberis]|uniref:VOC family protein n=1 Tax=Streptococcus parauberis TaxID=1348 RepID=UPI000C1C9BF9|nr:VOC family protein [Streptococcus parauberis]PIO79441.1 putative ring-cleaving dioxygenase MhqO [Streptococcus parauberis]PNY22253.1 putative ring-cleaving dioxygenase MhqO [Streptococcus parauberis]POS67505.1 putative ring-cleaving dioxygenase MhqO [Streptococcus parauberis]
MPTITSIHHISAMVGDVNENIHFYRDLLGLKLVKQTVNFDDPSHYHLYYSSPHNHQGLLTFFPLGNSKAGQIGSGQVGRIALSVPKNALDFWRQKLKKANIAFQENQWGTKPALFFSDLDNLDIALVATSDKSQNPSITGLHGSYLLSSNYKASQEFLQKNLGLAPAFEDGLTISFTFKSDSEQEIIIPKVNYQRGEMGPGTVHHIAWLVNDLEELKAKQTQLTDQGFNVTVIRDRKYFQSIYLREPGKVIFEFATKVPGLTVDEAVDSLGQNLQLPSRLEQKRQQLIQNLEPLDL